MFESARNFHEFYERLCPRLSEDERREMGLYVWSYEKFAVDYETLKSRSDKARFWRGICGEVMTAIPLIMVCASLIIFVLK